MINATKTIERARRKLGAPIIDVELTDEQMTSLLKDAQETFYLYAKIAEMPIYKQDEIEDAWIKAYFYALCKETLGRIRGKFGGKITLPGVETTMEYESLLSESEREKCMLKYLVTKDKETLSFAQTKNAVFVMYINSANKDRIETQEMIMDLEKRMKKIPGFTYYLIPTQGETKVECIYPVSDELDESEQHVIDRLNNYLNELKSEENEQQN